MAEGVARGALLPGGGARAGGPLGVFAIDGGAALAPTKDRVSCDSGRDGLGC